MVSFEDLRRIPPFMDVRLDELDGVLESQASSREENLIVAKSAHRQFCRNANVKQRQMYELVGCLFCITHRNTGLHCILQLQDSRVGGRLCILEGESFARFRRRGGAVNATRMSDGRKRQETAKKRGTIKAIRAARAEGQI